MEANDPICPHCGQQVDRHNCPINGPRNWHKRCWYYNSGEYKQTGSTWLSRKRAIKSKRT